jgi:hypothetical protein
MFRIRSTSLLLIAYIALAAILVACARNVDEARSPAQPNEGFPADIYPSPIPPIAEGGAILDACPNPDGLERLSGITDQEVISMLQQLWSDDTNQARRVSDPGFWPVLSAVSLRDANPQSAWLDGHVRPAAESPFASSLAQQCGEALIDLAWTFTVCTPECQAQNSSSLKEDYFIISRGGQLLVWAVWP